MNPKIIANIIPYEGCPFKKSTKLIIYAIKEDKSLDYPEIGFYIKEFKKSKENHEKIIFHMGKTIYSSDIIDDSNSKLKLENFYNLSVKNFTADSEDERFILKLYIGELVAYNLRNFRENWRVNNKGNTVFQALRNENWDLIGEAISCEAFEYEPIIYENGSFCLIIEPKHRLFMNYSLRIDEFQEKLTKASYLVDYCPIDCYEKNDSYYLCKLSNPEYLCSKESIRIREDKKPSTYPIIKNGREYNIIQYSNLKMICPRNDNEEKLGAFIKDKPPIIEVERILDDKLVLYGYPLERLRFSFDYRLIEDIEQRKKLNSHLRPSPIKKWNRFLTISQKLKNLIDPFGNKTRDDNFLENNFNIIKINQLKEVNFQLFGKISSFPQSKLRYTGPYDKDGKNKRSFEKIKLIIISFEELELNNIRSLEYRLTSTQTNYLSVPNLFCLKANILPLIVCNNSKNLEDLSEKIINEKKKLKENEKLALIAIYPLKNNELVENFKKFCIKNQISCQGLNIDRISEKLKNQSTMINVFLGLYVKLKGIPWIIQNSTDNEKIIIGFHKVKTETHTAYCLIYYNSKGIFINGKARYILNEDFEKVFKVDLEDIEKLSGKIIFLGLGSQNKIIDLVLNVFKKKSNDFSYFEVDKASILNLFEIDRNNIKAAMNGYYAKIEKNIYYLQTNYFEDCVPATIKIKKIFSENIIDDLQEIYNISQYNPHYAGGISTTLPLPLHILSKNALPDILNYQLNLDNIITPWFY